MSDEDRIIRLLLAEEVEPKPDSEVRNVLQRYADGFRQQPQVATYLPEGIAWASISGLCELILVELESSITPEENTSIINTQIEKFVFEIEERATGGVSYPGLPDIYNRRAQALPYYQEIMTSLGSLERDLGITFNTDWKTRLNECLSLAKGRES